MKVSKIKPLFHETYHNVHLANIFQRMRIKTLVVGFRVRRQWLH